MRSTMLAFILAASAILNAPTYAVASGPLDPLQPVSSWTLDKSPDACTLSRTFGDPAKSVALTVAPFPLGKSVKILVVEPKSKNKRDFAEGAIGFGNGHTPIRGYFRIALLAQDRGALFSALVDQAPFVEQFKTSSILTIHAGSMSLNLQVGPSGSAVAALNLCTAELLNIWGMDAASQAAIKTAPEGSVTKSFQAGDYPSDALRNMQQGTTGVRFWVGVDGKLSDCRVIASSGIESLDIQTCRVLQMRGRLTPAKDISNRPVRSLSSAEIAWIIPED